MVHLGKMRVETALFFETVEEIYARVFRSLKPRTPLPTISVQFRRYANANSKVRLGGGELSVRISDLLQSAPAPIQEALAVILLGKLFRRPPDEGVLALYHRYLNRAEVRQKLHLAKQQRGRKTLLPPQGKNFNLIHLFRELNKQYFYGALPEPQLGWSVRRSRTVLGHYDPAHGVIVLSRLLDSSAASPTLVRYVMYHEMLHIAHPSTFSGTRRNIHTREFKQAEKLFEQYAEARRELETFAEQAEVD